METLMDEIANALLKCFAFPFVEILTEDLNVQVSTKYGFKTEDQP